MPNMFGQRPAEAGPDGGPPTGTYVDMFLGFCFGFFFGILALCCLMVSRRTTSIRLKNGVYGGFMVKLVYAVLESRAQFDQMRANREHMSQMKGKSHDARENSRLNNDAIQHALENDSLGVTSIKVDE